MLKGICITCDAVLTFPDNTEESEIISCNDCKSRLVIEKINKQQVTLQEAPVVEEDWGE